ncbi:hypothetical protein [Cupriavidus alkaliphilus]|uniref:hypothetical protein n=1 Tax=Cupriavidus alkaliphilus TaxID=942866 RepID=UPI000DC4A295|nr:hypothetical protein [Cupriavidus alkaliphilus]RAS05028.1 hypothetical protein C7415_109135 [Cupriavidus alkaliphilus]
MKPNETRSFIVAEANATELATKPQPALKPITRVVNVAVQYVGREDMTAKGVTYKGACKLALHYERKDPAASTRSRSWKAQPGLPRAPASSSSRVRRWSGWTR